MWVYRLSKISDFIVKMGPITTTSISGKRDQISFMDYIARLNTTAVEVRVAGFKAIVMLNDDPVAAEFSIGYITYNPVSGHKNLIFGFGPEINPLM